MQYKSKLNEKDVSTNIMRKKNGGRKAIYGTSSLPLNLLPFHVKNRNRVKSFREICGNILSEGIIVKVELIPSVLLDL